MKYHDFILIFLILGIWMMNGLEAHSNSSSFQLKIPAFEEASHIPAIYTCEGEDLSPEIFWTNAPEGSESFVLTCIDPDAPNKNFVHWLVYNIPADSIYFPAGMKKQSYLDNGAMQGVNGFNNLGYNGPCPPSEKHTYVFTLYALDTKLNLPAGATLEMVKDAMQEHILAKAETTASFKAQNRFERQRTAPNPSFPYKRGEDPNAIEAPYYPPRGYSPDPEKTQKK